jgi:hypothetical protein
MHHTILIDAGPPGVQMAHGCDGRTDSLTTGGKEAWLATKLAKPPYNA